MADLCHLPAWKLVGHVESDGALVEMRLRGLAGPTVGGGIESTVMRFGLFIPQGWRLDLVDIPTDKHWQVMRDLAAYADGGPWDSLWVYDHFHTIPMPTH
jgi:hypothetical protein